MGLCNKKAEVHSARYVNVIILNDLFLHIITSLIIGILKKLPQEEHVFHTPTELSNEHELDAPTDELPEGHVFDASSDELKKRWYDSLWLEVDGIKLNKTQKDILSSTGWLDDKIVNAAQSLLRKQFGLAGLQNTTLGYTLTYDIMRKQFVQILHNGQDHWLTVSTIGLQSSYINIFDSMYSTLSSFCKDQICALLFANDKVINVEFIDVDKQENTYDCGLYAIAYATSVCHGDDVSQMKYNCAEMRPHLMHCLETGIITRFPSTHRINGLTMAEEGIPVYCYCRTTQEENMIQCRNCKEWFHLKCDRSISRKNWKKPNYSWLCRNCL